MVLFIKRTQWFLPCFFLFFLSLKMVFLDYQIFGEFNLIYTLVAEVPWIIGFILVIELLFKKKKVIGYVVFNTALSALFLTILMYFEHFGTVVTLEATNQAAQVTKVRDSVQSLVKFQYILYFLDIVLFLFLHKYIFKKETKTFDTKKIIVLPLLLIPVLWVSAALHVNFDKSIVNDLEVAKSVGVFNYQVVFLKGEHSDKARKPEIVTQEKIVKLKENTVVINPEKFGIAKDKNLIVIQFESLQDFVINKKINNQEITPNMNALLKESTYFPNYYHQVGKGNTSDAEFSVNTSIYPVGKRAMAQEYGDRAFPSMPKILKKNEYSSATFHTNDKTFWNRENLYPALGFDLIYDKEFFGDDRYLRFGSVDEILYEKTLPELVKFKDANQKFYSHLIAMTSHHPYKMPKDMQELTLPEEIEGTLVGNYFQSVKYSDKALGQFIQGLKDKGLWEESVLVIYGDHTGLRMKNLEDNDMAFLGTFLGEQYTPIETLNVPLIIHIPGQEPQTIEKAGNHVDIMPTMMNLLGVSLKDDIYFGQDLFNQESNLIPERHYVPSGSFINNTIGFVPGANFDDGTFYTIGATNAFEETELYRSDYERALKLFQLSDDYIKSIPIREELHTKNSKLEILEKEVLEWRKSSEN